MACIARLGALALGIVAAASPAHALSETAVPDRKSLEGEIARADEARRGPGRQRQRLEGSRPLRRAGAQGQLDEADKKLAALKAQAAA
jgi:hypothetical protein